MKQLLMLRERGIRFIKEYETWFRIIGKFIGMVFVFMCINNDMGYFALLNSPSVTVLLALVCSIIPAGFIVFIVGLDIAVNMVTMSPLIGALVIIVMLIVYLLFLKFAADQTLVLLAVPVLMQWNMHFIVPVIAGLIFTPYAFIPAVAGMFMTKFIDYCTASASLVGSGSVIDYEGILSAFNSIFTQSLNDKDIWLFAIVSAAAIAVCFIISRLPFPYSWYVGLAAAAVAEIAAGYVAGPALGSSSENIIPGAVIGLVAGAIIQFFRCVVDYSRKEYVQFEDEDYYYYVKAIPKYLTLESLPDPHPSEDNFIPEAEKAAESVKKGMGKFLKKKKS